jgi:hypothetical protein
MMTASISLNESSKYNETLDYIMQNKHLPFNDWLKFNTVFDKPGKQGFVGILDLKNNKGQIVYKISQCINYLALHESIIMKGLNIIASYCPNFCRSFGILKCRLDPKITKNINPFQQKDKYPIEKDVLLLEYVDKSNKFYNYIRASESHIPEDILYSNIKQVLMAIVIAQKKKDFAHYDLHSNNIMIRKCNKDLVCLYVLDEDNQFCIPTLGYYPVIIDFGFSYINDMNDGPMWSSMAHTHVGFMSDRFDWVADPKLLLITTSSEIKEKRNTKKSKKFRRVVRNLFHPLDIDLECGWDNYKNNEMGATDYILEILDECETNSPLLEEYPHYCIDLFQSLVILPLEEKPYLNIKISYSIFVQEWIKIESQISSQFYNLYILKGVVDAARLVGASYRSKCKDQRTDSVNTFKSCILARIDEVAKFCNPKDIRYEIMLCSLLNLSLNIEGFLYHKINKRMEQKNKTYEKLPVKNTEQIYGVIEANIPSNYTYNKNTTVLIINNINETCQIFQPDCNDLKQINDLHPLLRGTYVYDLYKK